MNILINSMPQITNQEFEIFRKIIYDECGIKLTEVKKALVQARLMKRLRKLNISGYMEYHTYLMDHYDDELINLINAITTNKTDFFREPKHFDFLNEVVFPQFEREGKKKIRIWSAGCSTGEEPYSLAITIAEYYQNKSLPDIKILSTDIDTNVLQQGEDGNYSVDVLSNVDRKIVKKYFLKGTGSNEDFFSANENIKRFVFFRRLNLLDDAFPMKGEFDVIFCRNVVIYFDKQTRQNLFVKFHKYLNCKGCFFAGHSETLTGINDKFRLIGNTIYRKIIQ